MTHSFNARNWLLLLPFLLLLGITYWLDQQAQPNSTATILKLRHDPDAIVDNFSATRLNEQGTPHFIMVSKRMLHYPDDDSSTVEMPQITSLSPSSPALHASAKQGIITAKGDEVFLSGDVSVIRESGEDQDKLELQTEYLHVLPDKELLKTDRAVTVKDAYNSVNAIGLEMDNRARTIKLLSQVRSVYVPPNN